MVYRAPTPGRFSCFTVPFSFWHVMQPREPTNWCQVSCKYRCEGESAQATPLTLSTCQIFIAEYWHWRRNECWMMWVFRGKLDSPSLSMDEFLCSRPEKILKRSREPWCTAGQFARRVRSGGSHRCNMNHWLDRFTPGEFTSQLTPVGNPLMIH